MAVPSSMFSHQCPVNAKWLSRVIKLNYYELLQIYLSSGHVSNLSVMKSYLLTIYQIFFKYKKITSYRKYFLLTSILLLLLLSH